MASARPQSESFLMMCIEMEKLKQTNKPTKEQLPMEPSLKININQAQDAWSTLHPPRGQLADY